MPLKLAMYTKIQVNSRWTMRKTNQQIHTTVESIWLLFLRLHSTNQTLTTHETHPYERTQHLVIIVWSLNKFQPTDFVSRI